jgi:hypothetical protein
VARGAADQQLDRVVDQQLDRGLIRVILVNDRAGLERLCRYVLRPPFARERLRVRDDGRVALVPCRLLPRPEPGSEPPRSPTSSRVGHSASVGDHAAAPPGVRGHHAVADGQIAFGPA